jgi:pimeloyl-ACP methyl ester carboxylesterase
MATFVLVHGAWAGGWCWSKVTPHLRAKGHDVYPITLTGLGERAHLASPSVDLDVHIRDVTAVLEYEELHGVTLVGHSYGGTVISGAAGAMPERVSRLVYIDSRMVAPGESMLDTFPPETRELVRRVAKDGLTPPPPVGDDMAWWRSHVTPHPVATWEQPIPESAAAASKLPRVYIACTQSDAHPPTAAGLRGDPAWTVVDIDSDHFPMFWVPERLAELLIDVSE